MVNANSHCGIDQSRRGVSHQQAFSREIGFPEPWTARRLRPGAATDSDELSTEALADMLRRTLQGIVVVAEKVLGKER
jgi:hypothetical protein